MMVLLRHMYGVPYNAIENRNFRLLQNHASVSVVAVKYRYDVLEVEACERVYV